MRPSQWRYNRYARGQQGANASLVRGKYGVYVTDHDHPSLNYILVDATGPEKIDDLLLDAESHFGPSQIRLYLDGRMPTEELQAGLESAGCTRTGELLYLTFVRAAPDPAPPLPTVTLEAMTKSTAGEYYTVWSKGFSDTEDEPVAATMEVEVTGLVKDMAAANGFLIARVDGEAAAIAGWYEATDRLIFSLATRVPYRNRGLARSLLSHIIADTMQQGCHSVSIFTDPEDTPVEFYRRMGFTEAVYRQIRFTTPIARGGLPT